MKNAAFLCLSVIVLLGATASAQQDDVDAVPLIVFKPSPVLFGPEEQAFRDNLKDILFDFNSDVIKPAARDVLNSDAQWLKEHPQTRFFVDGYADWRGGVPYNMDLSQRRAEAVKNALTQMGIPEDRIVVTAGWGKLYPTCEQQSEDCWQQNRRVNFEYIPPSANVSVASK